MQHPSNRRGEKSVCCFIFASCGEGGHHSLIGRGMLWTQEFASCIVAHGAEEHTQNRTPQKLKPQSDSRESPLLC